MTLTKTPVCDFGIKAKDFKLKSIDSLLKPMDFIPSLEQVVKWMSISILIFPI